MPYRATSIIEFNGSRAFNPGDPVPDDNVERHGYLEAGLVEVVEAEVIEAEVIEAVEAVEAVEAESPETAKRRR